MQNEAAQYKYALRILGKISLQGSPHRNAKACGHGCRNALPRRRNANGKAHSKAVSKAHGKIISKAHAKAHQKTGENAGGIANLSNQT